jgi:hypothetical protein
MQKLEALRLLRDQLAEFERQRAEQLKKEPDAVARIDRDAAIWALTFTVTY